MNGIKSFLIISTFFAYSSLQAQHCGRQQISGQMHNGKSPKAQFKMLDCELQFETSFVYEIYDAFGKLVQEGEGLNVDISDLEKGVYYINYGKYNDKFICKRRKCS